MDSKTGAFLRAFGMSGFQVLDDLAAIEDSKGLNLGAISKPDVSRALEGYDQFSQDLRAQSKIMSEYYEVFFCLENTIRQLITNILKEQYGVDWWEKECVNQDTREKIAGRQQKEIDTAISVRSELEIDFTTFGELTSLIVGNWDLFETIFTSRKAVERIMAELNVLRGPIAHCCAISEHEQERLKFAVKNWLRIVS